MTHVFPYINTLTGFFVWLIVVLNAGVLCALVYKVVRHTAQDTFTFALFMEGVIAFNLLVCVFLLFHPSLLEISWTGSFWSNFFSLVLWYYILKFVLFMNGMFTFKLIISVGDL
ncbi:hypothetical protein [Burkholderia vietnamiensis]|uniref:hypothetical protein n=1 Tax=Burkholderia vietnamiensis TaxID=60552 RepID=UPI001CF11C04|nr:hypothetical protein [Burkholderia vietnamiensis]MCA8448847.1 hypothetical protein [Burkholderia vietnamiensis]